MGWLRSWEALCVPTRYSLILRTIPVSSLKIVPSAETQRPSLAYTKQGTVVCWKAPLPGWDLAYWRHHCLKGNLSGCRHSGTQGCFLCLFAFWFWLCCAAELVGSQSPDQGLNPGPQQCSEVKVAQLCLTLCYTVHGILQARILEWVAFPSSRGSSQPRDGIQVSHIAGGFFTSWATRKPES